MALFAKFQFVNHKRFGAELGNQPEEHADYHVEREFNVVDAVTHFSRSHNHSRPNSKAQTVVEVTLRVPVQSDVTDLTLYQWYIDQEEKSCRLVYYIPSGKEEIIKEIYLWDALCSSVAEEYTYHDDNDRLLHLQIVADQVKAHDTLFQQ